MSRIDALKAAAISIGLSAVFLFVFRYVVEASSITVRGAWAQPFFYHGHPLGRSMLCATWLIMAGFLYLTAPVANRLPGVRSSSSARQFVLSTCGVILVIAPPLWFIAQCIIYAILFTVRGSWATDYTTFTHLGVYPHNMLLTLLPFSLCGFALLAFARQRISQ